MIWDALGRIAPPDVVFLVPVAARYAAAECNVGAAAIIDVSRAVAARVKICRGAVVRLQCAPCTRAFARVVFSKLALQFGWTRFTARIILAGSSGAGLESIAWRTRSFRGAELAAARYENTQSLFGKL